MGVHDIARSSACPLGSASCKANARPETWRNLRRSTREGESDAKETRTRAGREQTMLPMISAPFGAVTLTCSPPRAWAPATQDMTSANDGGQWSELCESEGKEWGTAGAARGKRRGDQDTTDRAKQPNAARTAHNGTGCMLSGALELLPSHPAAPRPPLCPSVVVRLRPSSRLKCMLCRGQRVAH